MVRQRPPQPQLAKFRDFYVWVDKPPKKQAEVVFPGEEASVWELDEASGQYFLHSFYRHQPDLNIANPRVRDEIAKTIGFWLELGISGFRVDAVPFLIEAPPGRRDRRPARVPARPPALPASGATARPCCSAR